MRKNVIQMTILEDLFLQSVTGDRTGLKIYFFSTHLSAPHIVKIRIFQQFN